MSNNLHHLFLPRHAKRHTIKRRIKKRIGNEKAHATTTTTTATKKNRNSSKGGYWKWSKGKIIIQYNTKNGRSMYLLSPVLSTIPPFLSSSTHSLSWIRNVMDRWEEKCSIERERERGKQTQAHTGGKEDRLGWIGLPNWLSDPKWTDGF